MKKTLGRILCFCACLLGAEETRLYDLHSESVRAALKGKEMYASVCDGILTFQVAPGRKLPWTWRTVNLPLFFSSRKPGKAFAFRIAGELKLLDVTEGKKSEGVVLFLSYLQNGKRGYRFFSGFPRYGTTEWIPFSAAFQLPADAENPVFLCGLNNVTGTFGIRNLTLTEME